MQKTDFVQRLHTIIHNSGIRQTVIADALGLSAAAVSQFTHGTILPKTEQLSAILALLNVPIEKRALMIQELLILREKYPDEIEDEPENYPDETEDDRQNGFSENGDDFPDESENDDDDDPEKKRDAQNFEQFFFEPVDDPQFVLAEPVDGVPVIELNDLLDFNGEMRLSDFAGLRSFDVVVRDYGAIGTPVVVKATGDQLGLRYRGMLQLVIVDDLPLKTSMLRLAFCRNNEFKLLAPDKSAKNNGLDLLLKEKNPAVDFRWVMPVLEFTIIPLGVEGLRQLRGNML